MANASTVNRHGVSSTGEGAASTTPPGEGAEASRYTYLGPCGEYLFDVVYDGQATALVAHEEEDASVASQWALYQLPEVLDAVESSRSVLLVDGEPLAERLRRDHPELSYAITTPPGGLSGWRPAMAANLRSAHVLLGLGLEASKQAVARTIGATLTAVGAHVELIRDLNAIGAHANEAEGMRGMLSTAEGDSADGSGDTTSTVRLGSSEAGERSLGYENPKGVQPDGEGVSRRRYPQDDVDAIGAWLVAHDVHPFLSESGTAVLPRPLAPDGLHVLPAGSRACAFELHQALLGWHGRPVATDAVREALFLLRSRAFCEDRRIEVAPRVRACTIGPHRTYLYDLGQDRFCVTTGNGWRPARAQGRTLVGVAPKDVWPVPDHVWFWAGGSPLPWPVAPDSPATAFDILFEVIQTERLEDRAALSAWILGVVYPHGPAPALALTSRHGTGLPTLLSALFDPQPGWRSPRRTASRLRVATIGTGDPRYGDMLATLSAQRVVPDVRSPLHSRRFLFPSSADPGMPEMRASAPASAMTLSSAGLLALVLSRAAASLRAGAWMAPFPEWVAAGTVDPWKGHRNGLGEAVLEVVTQDVLQFGRMGGDGLPGRRGFPFWRPGAR